MKVILITGASSGIGYEAAKMLAQRGHRIYGGARRTDLLATLEPFGVTPLYLDVTDPGSAKAAVDAVLAAEGRIDVLVNNAGYGFYGPVECAPPEKARRQMDVNVFGLARMTQLVLPGMRERHSGLIVNVSSVAGRVNTYFGGWYHASKYAVEAISDATRMETAPFGIHVAILEPGAVVTPWGTIAADHLDQTGRGTAYECDAARVADAYRAMYGGSRWLTPTETAARQIVRACEAGRPRARYVFGFGARPLLILHGLLPARAFDRIMRAMFRSPALWKKVQ